MLRPITFRRWEPRALPVLAQSRLRLAAPGGDESSDSLVSVCRIDPANPLYRRFAQIRGNFGVDGFGHMLRNLLCLNAVLYPHEEVPHHYFCSLYGPAFSPPDRSIMPTGSYSIQFQEYLVPYRNFLILTLSGAKPEDWIERSIAGVPFWKLPPLYKIYVSERDRKGVKLALDACFERILEGSANPSNFTPEQMAKLRESWALMHRFGELMCLLDTLPLLWTAHRLAYTMDDGQLGLPPGSARRWREYSTELLHEVERDAFRFLRGEEHEGNFAVWGARLTRRTAKLLAYMGRKLESQG